MRRFRPRIGGPLIGGLLVASGLALNVIFYVLAALAVVGVLLVLVIPHARRAEESAGAPVPRSERQPTST